VGLRIAIFGQAAFGRDAALAVAEAGHQVVGVFAPPAGSRPDPLAELAIERGWPLVRHRHFRRKGEAIAERVDEYRAVGADLNLMPFTTVFLPPEIVAAPEHGSLCFHPSLLPAFRGGAALAWQIILGAKETGVSVFRPDEGVDTGPLLVQKGGVRIAPRDTAGSLYFKKLYPLGQEALARAVALVARGEAVLRPQPEEGASFQGLVGEDEAQIDWSLPGEQVDRLIRGCDPQPGAHTRMRGESARLFGSAFYPGDPKAEPGTVLAAEGPVLRVVTRGGTLEVAKLRLGSGAKGAATEVGLEPGERFGGD
jgi:methionyl-tRNA formyltransferase